MKTTLRFVTIALCVASLINATPVAAQLNFGSAAPLDVTFAQTNTGLEEGLNIVHDDNGTWMAVWRSNTPDPNIHYSLSTNDGTTWTVPAVINSSTRIDANPSVAGDGDGNWVIAYESTALGGDSFGTDFDVFYIRSTDNGVSWSSPLPLNDFASSDTQPDSNVVVRCDGNNAFVAVWQSTHDNGSSGTDSDIFAATSTDDGATWSSHVVVNSNGNSDSNTDDSPDLATDGAGNWVAVWRDNFGGALRGSPTSNNIRAATSTNNGATWSTLTTVNSNASTPLLINEQPAIETDGTGNWMAVWQSNDSLSGTIGADNDIMYSVSSNNGASWAPLGLVNQNASSDSAADTLPRLSYDSSTSQWAVLYTTGSSILGNQTPDTGATWSADDTIFSGSGSNEPQIENNGAGTWIALWETTDELGQGLGTDQDVVFAISTSIPVELSVFDIE
jgi:hypothetical protein